MIEIYCRGNRHGSTGDLCPECRAFADYARARTEHCPRMENKTFCSVCPTHCYAPARRAEIRRVMRYAGPRMLLYNPVLAIRHLRQTRKQRKMIHGNSV